MKSLSMSFLGSPPLQNHHKPFTPKPKSLPNFTHLNSNSESPPPPPPPPLFQTLAKTILTTTSTATTATIITASTTLHRSLPCFAAESLDSLPAEQLSSGKINLEAIVVSIDNFFNRYPFFVAGCAFIWLIATPVAEYYLSKCKYIYTIDAFKKLQEDPNAQLLDIRDSKTLKSLKSPNLKLFGKSTVQVEYSEEDPDGFVKRVLENFSDPGNTVLCILDDLDGDSMAVAELLFKNGFKEAYAIKGGVAGKKGWLEIQKDLLPPVVHITKRKSKKSRRLENNEDITREIGTGVRESEQDINTKPST